MNDEFADLDTVPDDLSDVEYPCKNCGREAGPYSGRGRKPTKCEACKTTPTRSKSTPKVTGQPASLAAQATETLMLAEGFIKMGIMFMGLIHTGMAMEEREAVLKEQIYAALLTDTEMCKRILKGGQKSAIFGLILAFGSFGAAVAPVAAAEFKGLRAARAEAKATEE